MIIDKKDLDNYESRYRGKLINSLAGVKQVVLIGTRSKDGFNNLAIFNSLIHIGANPPLWGFIFRPDTVRRDTLNNILETGEYTLNYVAAEDFERAHRSSAKYEKTDSEFEACEFSESFRPGCTAPFVAEARVKVAMKFEQRIDLTINNTILIIGSIQQIELDEGLLSPDGFVSLHQADILACAGLDAYYKTKFIERLDYARPFQSATKLSSGEKSS